jgi:VCBS repeat protein/Big-like domain-containing protein
MNNMYWARVFLCALLLGAFATAQVTFSKTAYGADQSPNSATTGDFDKDGKPDFAVIEAGNQLTIYLNIGTGKFSRKAQYAIAANDNPIRIDTADINGDGKLDIVIGKQFVPEFEIWYGNGDGTFTFGKDVASGSVANTYDFALADVNNDGKVDFVLAYNDDTSSFASTYLNDGSGNFTQAGGVTFTGFATNFAVADFDRDGKLDVLARVHDQLQLYKGDGLGSYALSTTSSVPSGFGTMTVGSFNHDSSLDVAIRVWNCDAGTCNSSSRSTVYIYLNDGSGHFGRRSSYTAGVGMGGFGADFPIPADLAGDLNGDGIQDILLPGVDSVNGNSVPLQYLLDNGDGHFTGPFSAGSFSRQDVPVVRDVNRNGRHDVILPAGSSYVLLNTNAAVMCTEPGSASLSVRICGPADGATVSRTFTVSAGANSPAGVTLMQLYVDGKKSFELWNDQLKRSVTVGAGTHRVSIVAWDRYRKTTTKTNNVTAQ